MFLQPPEAVWPKGSGLQKCLQPFESLVKKDHPVDKCGPEASASCPGQFGRWMHLTRRLFSLWVSLQGLGSYPRDRAETHGLSHCC